jgi:hypothetical protein
MLYQGLILPALSGFDSVTEAGDIVLKNKFYHLYRLFFISTHKRSNVEILEQREKK